MTDPLGQSQVIPYLKCLAEKGHHFHLISCEKFSTVSKEFDYIKSQLREVNIEWHPLQYTSNPPVISTLADLGRIKKTAKQIIKKNPIDIVHCRSYISALAGLSLKKQFGLKFIFDMRGFWANERVDGKIWNLKNPLYKIIYTYFKKKEKQFLLNADYVITLTENAKEEILKWKLTEHSIPIQVIPCCADLDLFNRNYVDGKLISEWKKKLTIQGSDFVLSYLGSIGTWYMLDEMLDFFKLLLSKNNKAKFLFITPDSSRQIMERARFKDIPSDKIIIQKASRTEVPELLSLSQFSIFFIKPVFSKKASSPTKMGEVMGMGIPIICNKGIGDIDRILSADGFIINEFCDKEYYRIIENINHSYQIDTQEIRSTAMKYFSLTDGIEKYDYVYNQLDTIK
jgi:glycosyltransferase involved in cell wall biosynthesis